MKDLPVALLSYEIVSIFWWTGCWSACYQLQPGRSIAGPLGRLMPLAQREKSAAVFQKALGLAEAQVAKATWISRLPIVKTAERPRLVVSLPGVDHIRWPLSAAVVSTANPYISLTFPPPAGLAS